MDIFRAPDPIGLPCSPSHTAPSFDRVPGRHQGIEAHPRDAVSSSTDEFDAHHWLTTHHWPVAEAKSLRYLCFLIIMTQFPL